MTLCLSVVLAMFAPIGAAAQESYQFSDDGVVVTDQQKTGVGEPVIPMDVSGDVSYRESCPYGTASDYTVLQEIRRYPDIPLKNSLTEASIDAFTYALGRVIPVPFLPDIMAKFMYEEYLTNNPDTDSASSKIYVYRHTEASSSGLISSKKMTVFKYVYYCYPEKDYQGTASIKTIYYVKQYF